MLISIALCPWRGLENLMTTVDLTIEDDASDNSRSRDKVFPNFKEAASYARVIALKDKCNVQLIKSDGGFAVILPLNLLQEHDSQNIPSYINNVREVAKDAQKLSSENSDEELDISSNRWSNLEMKQNQDASFLQAGQEVCYICNGTGKGSDRICIKCQGCGFIRRIKG